jgi:predicted phage gp36 major capsid-like protein
VTADEIKAEVQRVENDTTTAISNLSIKADEISASVTTVETQLRDDLDSTNDNIATLTKEVEAKMTSEEVTLAIRQTLDDGVDKVTTSTGYTFDEEGLTVSKSNSEMTTQITEDGMTIRRNDDAMLTADHTGVNAMNLHATTYLMVGGRSRFENYESNRTGCFWIGGSN